MNPVEAKGEEPSCHIKASIYESEGMWNHIHLKNYSLDDLEFQIPLQKLKNISNDHPTT